jgi:EmrB/QacA subfamily drug resistance transporter
MSARARWIALIVLCLGDLMIVLDVTIVNVALPSIRRDLGFSQTGLAWVVNGYLLSFGGFLLLGGRLADLFGQRRAFLSGLSLFTLASLACGLSGDRSELVVARVVQGLGGAVVAAVSLSLVTSLFTQPAERARAMGVFGFVNAGGGALGVLLSGIITDVLSWHWIFVVNVPIGVGVLALSLRLLPRHAGGAPASRRLDAAGAVLVTAALMLAVYAIVNANQSGWLSARTLGLLACAAALLVAFAATEARARAPLVPLALLRRRNLAAANAAAVLWAGSTFAWFFLAALYLQQVLHYSALDVGLAFLPATLITAAFSLGLSAKIILRCGVRPPFAGGLLLAAIGLLLFARTPVTGSYLPNVLPGMVLLGIGGGMAFSPLLLAAMDDAGPDDAGLASGIVNTSFMMGGALGLAILASVAASRTSHLVAAGRGATAALASGYGLAFIIGAGFALVAALLGAALLRVDARARLDAHAVAAHGLEGQLAQAEPGG